MVVQLRELLYGSVHRGRIVLSSLQKPFFTVSLTSELQQRETEFIWVWMCSTLGFLPIPKQVIVQFKSFLCMKCPFLHGKLVMTHFLKNAVVFLGLSCPWNNVWNQISYRSYNSWGRDHHSGDTQKDCTQLGCLCVEGVSKGIKSAASLRGEETVGLLYGIYSEKSLSFIFELIPRKW